MKLIIFECCRETDRTIPAEQSVKVEWAESDPSFGDLVSMGKGKRWGVVQVTRYQPAGLGQAIDGVYLVHIHRDDLPLPNRTEWTSTKAQPQETLFVELSDVGLTVLGLGFSIEGVAPEIGDRLFDYERQSGYQPWKVDRVEVYLPSGEGFYPQIHLVWCIASEAAVAA